MITFLESYMRNGLYGSPLTQVLVYATLFKYPKKIDIEIIQLLSNTQLDVNIVSCEGYRSPIELAIGLKRFDIAKLLVKLGAHPIDPCVSLGSRVVGVIQLLREYYKFGTNHYITWLLHEYLLSDDLPEFIESVIDLNILNETTMSMFAEVGRHPAHAILACGHEEMIRNFIDQHGSNLLITKDETGTSALQISAEWGAFESVKTLVNL